MPSRAAFAFSFRWRASGTFRIWIILDMSIALSHARDMLGPGSFTGAPPWTIMLTVRERSTFVVARNPDPHSTLPYLLRIPLEGGIALKAREPWPRSARVYCHPL